MMTTIAVPKIYLLKPVYRMSFAAFTLFPHFVHTKRDRAKKINFSAPSLLSLFMKVKTDALVFSHLHKLCRLIRCDARINNFLNIPVHNLIQFIKR